MSKSLGNQIGVTDEPQEMYGKTMKIPDEAMGEYYRLLLDGGASIDLQSDEPREAKRALAREIVAWLYSEADAQAAERNFDRVFVERQAPEEMEEATFESDGGMLHLPGLIAEEFGVSRSEARRLIDKGGATLGEEQLAVGEHDVPAERAEGQVLKVGKRRFRRLRAG
jgi:tyrosyl-tRNA synthetase